MTLRDQYKGEREMTDAQFNALYYMLQAIYYATTNPSVPYGVKGYRWLKDMAEDYHWKADEATQGELKSKEEQKP